MRQMISVEYNDGEAIIALFYSDEDSFEIHETGRAIESFERLEEALEEYIQRLEDANEYEVF